jgi:hypothetical protein
MSAKPTTFNGNLANLPAALRPLTSKRQWLCWRWEERTNKDGSTKWTKPPVRASDPSKYAKANDPTTWGTYQEALQAVYQQRADGIGFALFRTGLGAVDLDKCINPTDALDQWAEDIIKEAFGVGAYVENTVSGTGLRIVGLAQGAELQRRFTFQRETGAGLELYRDTPRYITISGNERSTCAELPSVDELLDTLLVRFGAPQSNGVNGSGGGIDFNNVGPQIFDIDYEEILQNGAPQGTRSDLFQSTVWHYAGRGWSAQMIADEMERWPNGIGQKYASRLLEEVERSYGKWQATKQAAATGQAAAPGVSWPQIRVIPGELPRVVNEAEEALIALGRPLYQRGSLLVRPAREVLKASKNRSTEGWRLVEISGAYLMETLTRAARFLHWDARAKNFVPMDAPRKIAETYMARRGEWKLPVLMGITTTPTLRYDGTILDQPGYDQETGLIFEPSKVQFPTAPVDPTQDDARAALGELKDVIKDFAFVTPADRAVALSGYLTAVHRRTLAAAPMHAFSAPTPGNGKSLLVDTISIVATGDIMPVIAPGSSEEEMEKRLATALMRGADVISIDNVIRPLNGVFLNQILSQEQVSPRVLGSSKDLQLPTNTMICATGNNLTIAGDMVRRSLLCTIDAGEERPELRRFTGPPLVERVRAERPKLVMACLTILRAWRLARPTAGVVVPPYGGFEDWSMWVREALVWLGEADPRETVAEILDMDPEREEFEAVRIAWEGQLGVGIAYRASEIIEKAGGPYLIGTPDLRNALMTVCGSKGTLNAKELSYWLRNVRKRRVNGYSFMVHSQVGGVKRWKLIKV